VALLWFPARAARPVSVVSVMRAPDQQAGPHPALVGRKVTLRPGRPANEPAIRCYAKVGFRPVGVMRQYERGGDGRFHDGMLMDLLREELAPGR